MKHKHAQQLQHKQFAFKADKVSDDGTFSGYGSVFGNVDSYREIVAPGAFADSLKAINDSGDPLPALWQHDPSQPIGGYSSLEEDDHGLKVEGFLMIGEVPMAKQAHALMQRRIVKGLSIGYYVLADSYDEKERVRTLTKLDLVEVSIVTFPANSEAQIDAVKAKLARGDLPTLREFEKSLREQGYSKTLAEKIAAGGYKQLLGPGDLGGGEINPIRAALDALRS
jgi:HK97 family phage prohead protease